MRVLSLLLCIPLSAAFRAAAADEGWKRVEKKDDGGVAVVYRKTDDGHLQYRASARLETSLSAIIAVFRDVEAIPEWFDRTRMAELVEARSATEYFVRSVHDAPFPVMDRDAVVHTTIVQDPETLTVTVRGVSAPDRLPEVKGLVRVPDMDSEWTLVPVPGGKVDVTFQGYADPGGKVPLWLYRTVSRMVLKTSPYKTMAALRRRLSLEKYGKERFPFIRERAETP